jgi:hypothetical protein
MFNLVRRSPETFGREKRRRWLILRGADSARKPIKGDAKRPALAEVPRSTLD